MDMEHLLIILHYIYVINIMMNKLILKKNEYINDSLFERKEEVQEDIFEFTDNPEDNEDFIQNIFKIQKIIKMMD